MVGRSAKAHEFANLFSGHGHFSANLVVIHPGSLSPTWFEQDDCTYIIPDVKLSLP